MAGVTAGALSGGGTFYLGGNQLIVGAQNASSIISGQIEDGGYYGGRGGSLGKTGSGTLTLSGSNSFTGATSIIQGTLALGGPGSIATSTAVSVGGGSAFDISQATGGVTIQDLNGAGTIFLGGVQLTLGTSNSSVFSGIIQDGGIGGEGGGSLVKQGSGALTLSGTNSYAGATSITNGTLALSGTGSLAASASVLVSSGATLDISQVGVSTQVQNLTGAGTVSLGSRQLVVQSLSGTGFSGAIQDGGIASGTGGSLVKAGAGTLTLTGTDTYTGGTSVQNGTLVLGTGGSLAVTNTLTLGNSGTSGVFQLGDAGTAVGTTVSALNTSGSGNGNAVVGGNAAVSTLTVKNSATDLYGGFLGGAGTNQNNLALTKTGAGTLTLLNPNTYTGATTITQGTLALQGAGSIAASPSVSVGAGATFDLSESGGGATIQDLTGSGIIFLGSEQLTVGSSRNSTFSGVIQDGGLGGGAGGSLNKQGTGTLTLTGAALYTGATTISAGTVQVGNGGSTGSITGSIADNAALVFDLNNTLTYAGSISGSGTVTQLGTGKTILTGHSLYSGATIVQAGMLDLNTANNGSLASNSNLTFTGSGTFNYDSTQAGGSLYIQSLGALTFSGGSGTVETSRQAFPTTTTQLIFSSLTRHTGATGNFVDNDSTGGTTNGSTNKFLVGGVSVGFIDPGIFYGGNNFATLDATGYVRGINYGSDTGSIISAGGSTIAGTLTSSSNVELTGAITAQTSTAINTLNLGANSLTLGNSQTLTVNGILESGGSATISGGNDIAYGGYGSDTDLVVRVDQAGDSLTISTPIAAAVLTESGAGTLHLNHSYTGTIYGSGGSVDIGSGSTITGNIVVGSGNALGGSGTVNGKITVSAGGSTYPGDPQILTASSIEYQSGSTAQFAIATTGTSAHPPVAGTDYDQLKLTGATAGELQIDSGITTLQFNLSATSLAALQANAQSNPNDLYFVFALGSGTSTGQFSNLTLTEAGNTYTDTIGSNGTAVFAPLGLQFDIIYTANSSADTLLGGNDVAFSVQTAPEPATWFLLAAGGAALLIFRRCGRPESYRLASPPGN